MSVESEFDAQLAAWRQQYAGRPKEELVRLWLLALERERIVTIAYREEVIGRRLATMPIPEDVREVVRTAIRWAWRDEEMHAVYVRGALLRLPSRRLRAQAWVAFVEGAVAGWTSSSQQHHRWREAPLRRLVAETLEIGGLLGGKIPEDARQELQFRSFRDFARFNVAAERTACVAWGRIAELAKELGADAADVDAFRRMEADEARHTRVFGALVDAFDDDDRLAKGVSAASLRRRLGEAGESFVTAPKTSALGSGAVVAVATGDVRRGAVLRDVVRKALDDAGITPILAAREKAGTGWSAAIKTSFMLGVDRRDRTPIVDPALLDALVDVLREHGCGDVAVIDGPNVYDRFHAHRSVKDVAAYMGVVGRYEVVDALADRVPHEFRRGMGTHAVSRRWKDADLRVLVGKVRSHPVDVVALGLATMEGLGGRHDDHLFAERTSDPETPILMALDDFPPDFAVLDAWEDVPDGLLGMMGSPRPHAPHRVYAGLDAVGVDVVACRHVGADPESSTLLRAAFAWFGRPTPKVVGLDAPIEGWRAPSSTPATVVLSALAWPMWQHGSRRGALFVPPMDEDAFPPRPPPSLPLRGARRVVRRITGMTPGRGP